MVSNSIISKSPYKDDTLIIIHAIEFSITDYQDEGLTAAIIGWAAKVFNFEAPEIKVTFNKQINRYELEIENENI